MQAFFENIFMFFSNKKGEEQMTAFCFSILVKQRLFYVKNLLFRILLRLSFTEYSYIVNPFVL